MSHEIRTPINAVLGMNEMILRESKEGHILDYSKKIKTAGQRLLDLVNELLDYSSSDPDRSITRTEKSFIAPEAHILVVDDEPMNLEVFKSLLKHTRIKIDRAGSGEEALILGNEKKYDMIFLDLMMPGKDGIETLHELRAQKDAPNHDTPAVCITANVISGAAMYLNEGFEAHLTKPVHAGNLEDILLEFLPEEKIETVEVSEEPVSEEDALVYGKLKTLKEEAGIDIDAGIRNSGNVKAYLPLLKIFYSSMEEKTEELERFLSEGDIKNYTIKVHALKSSAKIIGAGVFAGRAEALEMAGKSGDLGYIKENNPGFLKEYADFAGPLSGVFEEKKDDKDKPEADEAMMDGVYEELRSAADDMDCEKLQAIFMEMEEYRIRDAHSDLWKKLKEASANYDYDGVMELIDNKG